MNDTPIKTNPQRLLVQVRTTPEPGDVERRFEYEGLFASSFAAYDDALERFPWASRIELKPVAPRNLEVCHAARG